MRRLSGLTWTGLSLVATGFLVVGVRELWEATRIDHPVSMPVSLGVGEVRTPEFKVTANQYYEIRIETKKRLPFETQCCLMGIAGNMFKCNKESVIQADWTVWNDRRAVAHGSSLDTNDAGFSDKTLERYLGYFKGESGKKYVLDVNFTKDGTQLAATDPHLNMEVSGMTYEDYVSGFILIFGVALLIEIVGVFLLIVAAIRHSRIRHAASSLGAD
ncbi:MAG: hypothetical protein ABSG60_13675 [Terracidiphilus sp.]|jgi:hypothetical protein